MSPVGITINLVKLVIKLFESSKVGVLPVNALYFSYLLVRNFNVLADYVRQESVTLC